MNVVSIVTFYVFILRVQNFGLTSEHGPEEDSIRCIDQSLNVIKRLIRSDAVKARLQMVTENEVIRSYQLFRRCYPIVLCRRRSSRKAFQSIEFLIYLSVDHVMTV